METFTLRSLLPRATILDNTSVWGIGNSTNITVLAGEEFNGFVDLAYPSFGPNVIVTAGCTTLLLQYPQTVVERNGYRLSRTGNTYTISTACV